MLKPLLGRILGRRYGGTADRCHPEFNIRFAKPLHAVSVRRASDQTRIAYWDLRIDTEILLFEGPTASFSRHAIGCQGAAALSSANSSSVSATVAPECALGDRGR